MFSILLFVLCIVLFIFVLRLRRRVWYLSLRIYRCELKYNLDDVTDKQLKQQFEKDNKQKYKRK